MESFNPANHCDDTNETLPYTVTGDDELNGLRVEDDHDALIAEARDLRKLFVEAGPVGHANAIRVANDLADALEAATSPRVPADVAEVLAKARMECAQKYLYSYWFSFKETGCGAIDEILSWIARAGKSYHSTEQWNDAEDGDPSKIDLIQSAANDAAKIINTLADTLARVAVELSRKQAAYEAVGFELVETRDKLNTAIARAEQAEKRAAEWEKEWQEKGFLLALARDEHSADLLVAAEMEGTLRGEIETLEQRLGNILARIHGDGGHYMGKHGVEKACEDADAIICERLTERDTLRAELTAARAELAQLKSRRFPVMDGPSIPWPVILPYEAQAVKNHGQTLERLAQRGGLSSVEAARVLKCQPLFENGRADLSRDEAIAIIEDAIRRVLNPAQEGGAK